MTAKERRLQERLRDWLYILQYVEHLQDQLDELTINITTNYDISGVSCVGGKNSKVENHYIKKEKKELELAERQAFIKQVENILYSGALTKTEIDLVLCIMYGRSLKEYAEEHGIYKSYVYKMKDAAVRKIAKGVDIVIGGF